MVSSKDVAIAGISALVGGVVGYAAKPTTTVGKVTPEPQSDAIARGMTFKTIFQGVETPLSLHPVLSAPSPAATTYLLVTPMPTYAIEGIMEVWRFEAEQVWVVEIARLCWGKLIADGHGKHFEFPEVTSDNVVSPGYVSFRVT